MNHTTHYGRTRAATILAVVALGLLSPGLMSPASATSGSPASDPASPDRHGPPTQDLTLGPTLTKTDSGPTGYSLTLRYQAPDTVTSVQVIGEWLFSKPSSITSTLTADLRTGADWLPGDVVAGYNNGWKAAQLTKGADGIWSYTTPLPSGTFSYTFTHDCASDVGTGCPRIFDPANPPWTAGLPVAQQVNSQVYVPNSRKFPTYDNDYQEPVKDSKLGTIENRVYTSPTSTAPVGTHNITVYLPDGYKADRSTPYTTLYLSHGGGGNDTDWTTQGVAQHILEHAIQDGDTQPMIIVMTNFTGLPGGNQGFADDVKNNVIPFVEANYNVSTSAADRSFSGLSAGGSRTNTLLYDNTSLFEYYGSWSAAGGTSLPTAEQVTRMQAIRGGIQMGTGEQDWLSNIAPNSLARVDAIQAAGIPVTEYNVPGIHSWDVWRQQLDFYLRTFVFRTTETSVTVVGTGNRTQVTATVAPVSTSAKAPSGKVQFYAGDRLLGSAPLHKDGSAQLSGSLRGTSPESIVAKYVGDNFFNGSSSAP